MTIDFIALKVALRPQPFVFWKPIECSHLLFGNGYAYIHCERDLRPSELIWLSPDCAEPYLSEIGQLLYRFFHPSNGKCCLPDSMSVLHYRGYTEDSIHGISVLHHARNTLEAAVTRETYDKTVYQNGGIHSGMLETNSDPHGCANGPAGKLLKR